MMGLLPLRDVDLRAAAHRQLLRRARACPDTLVIDELGLSHGACRMDIAVINGHIRGLEIKAEADNLARLPRQVAAYGTVVDFATLIVADRHVDEAMAFLPNWWGLISARRDRNDGITFKRLQPERFNRGADPMTIARLLWRSEVISLLRAQGHHERTMRAPRATLYAHLVAEMPRRLLSQAVRDALKARQGWRGHG